MDGLTHLMKIKSRIRRHQLRNGAVGKGGTPSPCILSIEPEGKPVSIILLAPSARQRSTLRSIRRMFSGTAGLVQSNSGLGFGITSTVTPGRR